MEKCDKCGVLMADKAEYCMHGHKQSNNTDLPDVFKDLFGGEFERVKNRENK